MLFFGVDDDFSCKIIAVSPLFAETLKKNRQESPTQLYKSSISSASNFKSVNCNDMTTKYFNTNIYLNVI